MPLKNEMRSSEPRRLEPVSRSRAWVWAKRLGAVAALLVALGLIGIVLGVRHYEKDLPSTAELKQYRPPQVTRVLARDGTLLGELFVERRTVIGIAQIPARMKLAVLAAEDASFYEHAGLNYLGMLRAIWVNLRNHGARQGASTITQQVVKNVLLTSERTMGRKVREAILSRRIEQELTKDEILELYLNHIYFGHGRYGVEEASRYYFGKSIRDITLDQAALLAAVPKGPSIYSPRTHLARATARRAYVLDQMASKGFATAAQVESAKEAPVVLAPEPEALAELAPEVVDEVRRTLRRLVGPTASQGGYTVTTTIDPALQAAARSAVRRNLDDYAKRHKLMAPLAKMKREPTPDRESPKNGSHRIFVGVITGADDARGTLTVRVGQREGSVELRESARYNPKNLLPSQFGEIGRTVRVSLLGDESAEHEPERPEDAAEPSTEPEPRARYRLELGPQSALVALDVRTREVLALVGSYESVRGSLDRALFAHRQPGSTFKTFLYSYAIHSRRFTAASLVPTSAQAGDDYRPSNHGDALAFGEVRAREALAKSVNASAVWLMRQAGASNVAAWANAMGIESKLGADLSLALGAYEVTVREMAAAYATLAAGGVYEQPALITRIVGPNSVEVPLSSNPAPRRVMDEAEAYVTTSLLTSVVESGTGRRARSLGRPIAGKTGTSNQSKDGWFVGYSPDVVCAVWTGYDDAIPLGASESGASVALPAFVDFMREAHKKRPIADFAVPTGVVRLAIDPRTGLVALPEQTDALAEVFLAGTEPTELTVVDAGAPDGDVDAAGPADAGLPTDESLVEKEPDGGASATGSAAEPAGSVNVLAPEPIDEAPSPLPAEPPPF
jgi:penicillin-binding protein 1A